MLVACFWPFQFQPPNEVVYVPGEQGLRFQGNGTAYSHEPFPSLRRLTDSNELTVEMTIRPKRISSTSLPYILSLVPEEGPPTLVIAAWKRSLVVRLGRPDNPGWKKFHEIGVGEVFAPGQTVHLVISLGPRGTTVFVDGLFKRSFPNTILDISDAELGRILLGNSPTGGSIWKGDILSLALYTWAPTPAEFAPVAAAGAHPDRVSSAGKLLIQYRFDKIHEKLIPNTAGPQYDIVIPAYFAPLRRTILEPPRRGAHLTLSSLLDIALNISGFMPFGFLAMLFLRSATAISPRRQSTLAVFTGFSLSLFIELTQVFLPTRSSSLTDLATNTLGTALGVLVSFIFLDL